jgi:hypothetical protein
MIGGGWETFRDHSWMQQQFSGGRSDTVDWGSLVGFRCLSAMDLAVFKDDPSEMVRSNETERLKRYMAPWRGELNTVQLDVVDLLMSTGHFGAYASAARGVITAEVPGYLRPIWSTAFSLPPRMRRLHRMQRHLLAHLRPDLARIPTDAGVPAEPVRLRNVHQFVPGLAERGYRMGRKRVEMKLRKSLRSGVPVGVRRQAAARVATVRRLGLDCARGRAEMRLGPLLNLEHVGRLCDGARDLGGTQSETLARIVTAEMALRAADAGF